ncbi:MAG: hypothetical protein LBR18_08990 [Tannerella sp.]|nr:hypothetical protein [Tannerella sp.]
MADDALFLHTKAESLPVNSAGHRPAAQLRSSIPKALTGQYGGDRH